MRKVNVLLLLTIAIPSVLQAQQGTHKNAAWIKRFTGPADSAGAGRPGALVSDPRFIPLLRSAFPQHQFFWRDHGTFRSVAHLAADFVGVTNKAILLDHRYAVVEGCVPHDCDDRALIWIDTQGPSRPAILFAATDFLSGDDRGDMPCHLWVFSSTQLNWQHLPPTFVSSVAEWWSKTSASWGRYFAEPVVAVSLVQPSGQVVALSPDLLHLGTPAPTQP